MRAFEIMRDFTMVNAAEAPSHKALKWDHLVGFAAMSAPAPILKHPGIGTVAQTFLSNVQRVKWMQTVISSMTKPAYYGIIEVENTWSHHAQTNSKLSCVTNVG